MLPVATPPNAIIFASNRFKVSDMAKAGALVSFIGVFLVVIFAMLWLPFVFDFEFGELPDWAKELPSR
jgi:sodium-dependent dicarboxylate transporter 2/3/5